MRALVQAIVDEVNARFATVEQIKKFRMLPKELDHEDGELTATQKVKRTAIATMFADLVEGMYAEPMTELVQCLVRGLGDGSVYALLAFGFVIIYKSMRRDQLRPAGVHAGRRGAGDLPGRRPSDFYLAVLLAAAARRRCSRWASSGSRCARWSASRCSSSRSSPSASTS